MATYSPKLRHELGTGLYLSGMSTPGSSIKVDREWPESGLSIGFQRTIRVSDNDSTNDLPPSLGSFPLFRTCDYKETLPSQMEAKGGYFLPMHRKFSLACAPTLYS
ncbi:hypothetical protein, partial [Campylobacter jejuni]|uniref:hypothetical protein n=1 Tax=Campylobacter jejuni TaxID=197 RepID=UPI00211B8F7F